MAKIFISHSSCDKEIIDLFKNKILNGGLGVVDEDIAYTSAVETGVITGGDIPQYIKDNIESCDFVFFMISENYRKSEICLNEMGASWALNKCIKPFIIGDIGFESIGWLYGRNLGAKIDDGDRLDELRDTFIEKYGLTTKTVVWNRCKAEFISSISDVTQPTLLPAVIEIAVEDAEVIELGLLDYRELFEQAASDVLGIMNELTADANTFTKNTQKETVAAEGIRNNFTTPSAKASSQRMAANMMKFSTSINQSIPAFKDKFGEFIKYAKLMHDCTENDETTKAENLIALQEFITAIKGTRESVATQIPVFNNFPNLEQKINAAKKKLINSLKDLVKSYDECLEETGPLLIKYNS